MQRARRTAVLAVLALAGALVLTGCRSEPGVAIYIGADRYTQQQVDGLATELSAIPGSATGDSRTTVVQWIVVRELVKRLASAGKWAAPQVDIAAATGRFQNALQQSAQQEASDALGGNPTQEQVAQAEAKINERVARQIETLRPAIQLYTEFQAYVDLAQQHVAPAEPSTADYADLYRRARDAGLVQPGMSEAQFRDSLGPQNQQVVAVRLGLRNMLADVIRTADVTINPRYAPAQLTVLDDGNNHSLIVLPLDRRAGSAPVRA